MRASRSLRRFLPCLLLAAGASADELDDWLASAMRVSTEALKPCPVSCRQLGDNPSKGFLYSDASMLAACNETMLLDMAVHNDKTAPAIVRACKADYHSSATLKPAFVADDEKASLCTTANRVLEEAPIHMHQSEGDNLAEFSASHLIAAGRQISNHLSVQVPSCTANAMEFAYFQTSAIGVFAGAEIHQHGVTSEVLKKLLQHVQDEGLTKTTVVQLCASGHGRAADYSLGIVATSAENIGFIREAVKTWASGGCVSQPSGEGSMPTEGWMKVTIRVPAAIPATNGTNSTSRLNSGSLAVLRPRSRLHTRADCRTTTIQSGEGCWAVAQRCKISQDDLARYNRANLCTTLIKDEIICCSSGTLPSVLPPGNADGTCKTRAVVSGDDCGSLASKCGISGADFNKVNTNKANLCSTLIPGQPVCCTAGKYPDLKPKPDANGNCATYLTKKEDTCSAIAAARDITVSNLESFNKNTWGWNGCDPKVFYPDFKMCVSTGTPPMPAIVENAMCGPTMRGTTQPPAGTNISTLNPCPLNVCCNTWGQCGLTDDFCVISKSATGAPGTSAPGKSGCISNCGRDIIRGSYRKDKIRIAYFESWNSNRKCMHMSVDEIDTSVYTHIHFAFPNVTRGDFRIEITDPGVKEQFEIFKTLTGVKKIISLGGWDFSALPGTFMILREAVLPANRQTFKNNIIAFLNEHNLDGIDLDWEYPGAPDIPLIPEDDPVNGLYYYRLLSSIKSAVGTSKSVSFAAPASFWYLRAFPIKQMADTLDYIVYMTYDLHGQWDSGNPWTSPGCVTGNCLRSHVNQTETMDALSMITKAGAPSDKVVVGVASYGRSFKMEQAGCDLENCKFTGDNRTSNAAPGRCTGTSGYISNAEIKEIIATGRVNRQWQTEGSNFLVYNDTEWVAYMDDERKATRSNIYDQYWFAGTTDWAVDLQDFWDGSGYEDIDEGEYIDENYWAPCPCIFTTLAQLEKRKGSVPAHCVEQYLLDIQIAVFEGALKKYKELLSNDYDGKFKTYEKSAKAQVPDQINNFMASDKVDKYFKCRETKEIRCCSGCSYATCGVDCVSGDNCESGIGTVDMDKCPKIEFAQPMLGSLEVPRTTYTLTNATGFYADIAETWGIDKSWIRFDKRRMKPMNGCQFSGEDIEKCEDEQDIWFRNFPVANNDKIQIYNPKKLIGDSYDKAAAMLARFRTVQRFGLYDELTLPSDLVDATSLPAFTAEEAIASMKKVVERADEIIKREREDFIVSFITGLLFFIPIVGEAAGAALTSARTLIRLVGAAGDVALSVYAVVENPENAFMEVFMALAGAGVGRAGFQKAASARRSLTAKEYKSLGEVKTKLDKVTELRGLMSCSL